MKDKFIKEINNSLVKCGSQIYYNLVCCSRYVTSTARHKLILDTLWLEVPAQISISNFALGLMVLISVFSEIVERVSLAAIDRQSEFLRLRLDCLLISRFGVSWRLVNSFVDLLSGFSYFSDFLAFFLIRFLSSLLIRV